MGTLHDPRAPPPLPMCPFSIRTVESALAGETSVGAAPCLGNACMAFTAVTNPDGSAAGGCALCLAPQTINMVAQQLAILTARLAPVPTPDPKEPAHG